MTRKKLGILLALEAVLCAAAAIVLRFFGTADVISFPFALLGKGLRALSLSGTLGNLAAIVLYAGLSLLPAAYAFLRWRKKKLLKEDALLLLLSAALFAVLYLMINPGLLAKTVIVNGMANFQKTVLVSLLFGIAVAYGILRFLRVCQNSGTAKQLQLLRGLLCVVCMLLVAAMFGQNFSSMLLSLESYLEDATGYTDLLLAGSDMRHILREFLYTSRGYIRGILYGGAGVFLQYLVSVIPRVMEIAVIFCALDLTKALQAGTYSVPVVQASQRLARWCKRSIYVVVLSQLGFNLLQVLLSRNLRDTSYTFDIPLFSIVFLLLVLLLAKFFAEGRALKEDNETII